MIELLTREQLATQLNVSTRHIMRLEKKGLPVISLGDKSPRYDMDQVIKWLQENQA